MDYDVIKEIPGYKVILKAVLKSQIQQLVEQLSSSAEEESVILTASIADGTLSHLGSESGKGFLEDHEDIKSQFLGFCLKKHHRKKQEEQDRQEAEALKQSLQVSPGRYGGQQNPYMIRSPRFASPQGCNPVHPVRMIRASPGRPIRSAGVRHGPYPMTRPPRRASLNVDPGRSLASVPSESPMRAGGILDGQVIKIEPDNEASNQSDGDTDDHDKPGTSEQSPSHEAKPPSSVKSEAGEKDDDARSESSTSTIPNETPSDGLGLDADLANLISGNSEEQSADGGELNSDVGVKLEVLNEAEMELEITGVEPGRPLLPQNDWDPNISLGMNFDPTGAATGNQGDMTAQGYNNSDTCESPENATLTTSCEFGNASPTTPVSVSRSECSTSKPNHAKYSCRICGMQTHLKSSLKRHERNKHSGSDSSCLCKRCNYLFISESALAAHNERRHSKPYCCGQCGKHFKYKKNLDEHYNRHMGNNNFQCPICPKTFMQKHAFQGHMNVHNGFKPYQCPQCGGTFSILTSYNRHVKECKNTIRSAKACKDAAGRQCEICGAVFSRKGSFEDHFKGQHDGHLFICGVCGEKYRYRSSLSKHKKKTGHEYNG